MVKNFTIFGERCSGTNFLETVMTGESYFHKGYKPAFSLPITFKYGHKHFFGHRKKAIKAADDTLFLCIARNPYDWITSLFSAQHHVPQHNYSPDNFLFNEWYDIEHNKFSDHFLAEILAGKHWEENRRYKNIFELRACKLRFLKEYLPTIVKNYVFITYEDLCSDLDGFIDSLVGQFGLELLTRDHMKAHTPKHKDIKFEQAVTNHIDWEVEEKCGYVKRPLDIVDFYTYNELDPEFDPVFYSQSYPDVKEFCLPVCQRKGIDDAKRLFFHYYKYGKPAKLFKNKTEEELAKLEKACSIDFKRSFKLKNHINIDGLGKSLAELVPAHEAFTHSFANEVRKGKKLASKARIAVVGLARDCDSQLQQSIDTVFSIESADTRFFVYENDSKDYTRKILKEQGTDKFSYMSENLGLEDVRNVSKIRTSRLSVFRNKCRDWVEQHCSDFDYVIVLDLDADLGFSVDGIYSSIYWLKKLTNSGGMGSYSFSLEMPLISDPFSYKFAHYDSFAVRVNDWQENSGHDPNNAWFASFLPLVGSPPIPFYSCFGGLAVYKTKAFLSGRYSSELSCEHVYFHKQLKANGWDMYLNPGSVFFSRFVDNR